MARINCFIPFANAEQAKLTVQNLKAEELVSNIYLLATEDSQCEIEGFEIINLITKQAVTL